MNASKLRRLGEIRLEQQDLMIAENDGVLSGKELARPACANGSKQLVYGMRALALDERAILGKAEVDRIGRAGFVIVRRAGVDAAKGLKNGTLRRVFVLFCHGFLSCQSLGIRLLGAQTDLSVPKGEMLWLLKNKIVMDGFCGGQTTAHQRVAQGLGGVCDGVGLACGVLRSLTVAE